ncbi:MAG TPA: lycopene cyclase domain-containing protein [Prolixibacteraceae bacterium]|nr:lycopene cyclase domain-containing protein [Prolixibacteraceae bacterium]
MELTNFFYLALIIVLIAVSLVKSFDKSMQLGKKFKYLLPAIVITSAFFLIWDINFTNAHIWTFNSAYTLGKEIKGLPIEEWLFVPAILYCIVFVYELVKVKITRYEYTKPLLALSLVVIVGFALISYFFRQQIYTFTAFLFSAVYLGYAVFRNLLKQNITSFYISYVVLLIPFLILYGVLTSLPLVEYHPAGILNIRVLNIPVENFAFFFLMLLMSTTIYEFLKVRKFY